MFFLAASAARGEGGQWWNRAEFYQAFVRSFYDSDGSGSGDFNGLTAKLDYLNDGDPRTQSDLGITGIWLMPITDSPFDDNASHSDNAGYGVRDYRKVRGEYGKLDDFREFLHQAHARGIKVIIDFVLNHTSEEHPWFIASLDPESSMRNWYRWADTKPPGPNWRAGQGGYYYARFNPHIPDLNYSEAAVREEMNRTTAFWLDSVGIDGFRLDAIRHLYEDGENPDDAPATFAYLKEYRRFYKGLRADAMVVGEAWTGTRTAARYVRDGGTDALDLAFEFDLASSILSAVRRGDATELTGKLREVVGAYPALQYANFLSNHDQDRSLQQLGGDVGAPATEKAAMQRARAAAGILLTLPGVPFIYYGEEIGLLGLKEPDERFVRAPMAWSAEPGFGFTLGNPWFRPAAQFPGHTVAAMRKDSNSLWHAYRRLIGIRNGNPALQVGDIRMIATGDKRMLAFVRGAAENPILVAVNLGAAALTGIALGNVALGLPKGAYPVRELLGGKDSAPLAVDASGVLAGWDPGRLEPYSISVFRIGTPPAAVRRSGNAVGKAYRGPRAATQNLLGRKFKVVVGN
jgi:glycosidase